MALTWTMDAEKALERAPRILRPLIRRRLEAAALHERRESIDLAFVQRIKEVQGPSNGGAPVPDDRPDRDARIGEDLLFLAELCERFCRSAHAPAPRQSVPPAGVLAAHLDAARAPSLCADCRKLFLHMAAKRVVCPCNPKPSCRNCTRPCHQSEYRHQMARIMSWNVEQPSAVQRRLG